MLKTHCVTNLRASTQRCACCVLELLRSRVFETLLDLYRRFWRKYATYLRVPPTYW